MERKTHTIDAKDKVLGRLAVDIALLLRGKNKPTFAAHKDEGDFVIVQNASKIKVTGKKMEDKIYYRHTGYIGGLKKRTMKELISKKPGEALRKAVYGMIPDNKLRKDQIKRLKIEQ